MKVKYDPETDTLTIELKAGKVAESDESKPGIILDFNDKGDLLGLEILDASTRVDQTQSVQLDVAAA